MAIRKAKSKWGGARKGAGRKPKKNTPVAAQDALGRIADSLDKLLYLYSMELRQRGLCLETGDEEGEVILDGVSERELFERAKEASERDRAIELKEWEASLSVPGGFGVVWSGPEGAENPQGTV